MKKSKLISMFFLLLTLISFQSFNNSAFAQGQGRRGTPPGMELPSDWDSMTETERRTYMEANKPEGAPADGESRQRAGRPEMELPLDWDSMTETEQAAYMEANKPEGMEQGGRGNEERGKRPEMELPLDWDSMTETERQAYLEDNKPEIQTENFSAQKNKTGTTKNYTKKAQKAKYYKKFTGTLQSKKRFNDESEIENQEAVSFLQQRGILDGYSDGSFGAKKSINRAESLKVLLEALGESPDAAVESEFSDVDTTAWYAGYISKAKRKGIVNGYEDGSFKPAKTVSQVELLKIAFESFGLDLSSYAVSSLPVGVDGNAWYAPYLQYALDNNLLDEESLDLVNGMDREGFSELVYRLIQQQEAL